jgi:hypothetical protein
MHHPLSPPVFIPFTTFFQVVRQPLGTLYVFEKTCDLRSEKAGVGGSIPSLATIIPKDLDGFTDFLPPKAPPKIITELAPSAGEFCPPVAPPETCPALHASSPYPTGHRAGEWAPLLSQRTAPFGETVQISID